MLMMIKKMDVFNLQIMLHRHTQKKKQNTFTSKAVLPQIFTVPQFYKMKFQNMLGSFKFLDVYTLFKSVKSGI